MTTPQSRLPSSTSDRPATVRRSRLAAALLGAVLLGIAAPSRADAVADWYSVTQAVRERVPPGTDPVTEQLAPMVALAMYDAVVSIEGGYRPYLGRLPAAPGASAVAAAAAAAHGVLVELAPADRARFDRAYAAALATVRSDASRAAGIAVGEAAARRLLARHPVARPSTATAYRPPTQAGRFVPPQLPAREWLARLPAFVLQDPDAFRMPGPPPLDSAAYARDYAEVEALGARNSTARTAEQTDVAQFWHSNGLAQLLPQFFARPGRTLVANARLFAMQAVAEFDMATILVREKYRHDFWRPITAIRNGDLDDNPATTRDAEWEPLLSTPSHPDYPCGHCLVGAMTGAVLATEFGPRPEGGFTVASSTPGGTSRHYDGFDSLSTEMSNSRVWGGVHFRSGARDGAELGRRIAASVAAAFARDGAATGPE